jgi:hypothetical protein
MPPAVITLLTDRKYMISLMTDLMEIGATVRDALIALSVFFSDPKLFTDMLPGAAKLDALVREGLSHFVARRTKVKLQLWSYINEEFPATWRLEHVRGLATDILRNVLDQANHPLNQSARKVFPQRLGYLEREELYWVSVYGLLGHAYRQELGLIWTPVGLPNLHELLGTELSAVEILNPLKVAAYGCPSDRLLLVHLRRSVPRVTQRTQKALLRGTDVIEQRLQQSGVDKLQGRYFRDNCFSPRLGCASTGLGCLLFRLLGRSTRLEGVSPGFDGGSKRGHNANPGHNLFHHCSTSAAQRYPYPTAFPGTFLHANVTAREPFDLSVKRRPAGWQTFLSSPALL